MEIEGTHDFIAILIGKFDGCLVSLLGKFDGCLVSFDGCLVSFDGCLLSLFCFFVVSLRRDLNNVPAGTSIRTII